MGLVFSPDRPAGVVLEEHLSVKAASKYFGYNEQYLRRLLRAGRLEGTKLGQVWLIRLASLEAYLGRGQLTTGRRYGPHGLPHTINGEVAA